MYLPTPADHQHVKHPFMIFPSLSILSHDEVFPLYPFTLPIFVELP